MNQLTQDQLYELHDAWIQYLNSVAVSLRNESDFNKWVSLVKHQIERLEFIDVDIQE